MTIDREELLHRMVVFEGADKVGKSSIITGTAKALREQGYRVVIARSPGTTELGEHLRGFLKDASRKPMSNAVEAQLQFAGFFQLFDEVILPSLTDPDEPADLVLVDRFSLSTYMYQRDQTTETLIMRLSSELLKYMQGYPVRILVDAKDEKLASRGDGAVVDRYEENKEWQKRIVREYRVFTGRYPDFTIFNNDTLEQAIADAITIIQRHALSKTE